MALLTTAEAALRLGVPLRTVQAWAASGNLPTVQVGRFRFVEESSLDEVERPTRGRPVVVRRRGRPRKTA
jgi:excisionase family DNA binding protein